MLLSLGACHSGRVSDDEVVVLIESAPSTFDPRFCVSAYDFKLSRLVYAPLVSVDNERVEPQMELAESVEMRTPTEYWVTLRDGARFSDGRAVSADDVVYTIDSMRDPKVGSRLAGRFRDDGLQSLEAVDARRVRFRIAHAHAPFVTDLDFGILARPAPGHESDAPLGAGPFVPESSDHERYRFHPNAYYFAGAPKLRTLTVKVIRDDNSRLLALVGGSGDVTQNTVTPLLLDAVSHQKRLRVETARSAVFSYLALNCDDPITKNPLVRRAIALAIDRKRIIETKIGGHAQLATGMLPTFHWAYSREVESHDYDPKRARALLDEAGFPDPDGAGPKPRFTLIYKTSSNRYRLSIAQLIAAELAEVGIAVELHPLEFSTLFADMKAGNFQMLGIMQIPEIAEPDLYTNFFHSSRIPTHENPDRGGNRARFRSDELDAWIDRGRRDVERPARIADYQHVQQILAHELPVIPLWHEDNIAVLGRNVDGFQLLPSGQLTSLSRVTKRRD